MVKGSLVPGWFSGNMMTLRDRFIMQEAADMEVPEHQIKEEGLSVDEVNDLLNKKSGVLGISGISSDFRDIEE